MTPEQVRAALAARKAHKTGTGTRRSKYNNVKIGGYDSMKERRRAAALRMMERAGLIRDLEEQVMFTLVPGQRDAEGRWIAPVRYVADFTYHDEEGRYVVEDVKGVRTDVYTIKKKLMLAKFGITIKET